MPAIRTPWCSYVAPPCYSTSVVPGKLFGHSPIDIRITGFAPFWWDDAAASSLGSPGNGDFQLWRDGATIGPVVSLPSGGTFTQMLAAADRFLVPAVSEDNVDGASRFGLTAPSGAWSNVAILYEAVHAADVGKTVRGLGSDTLCTVGAGPYPAGGSEGLFSPLVYHDGYTATAKSQSDIFNFQWESEPPPMPADGGPGGDSREIAVVPFAVPTEIADLTFVDRSGSGPSDTVSLVLRINGEDALVIDLAPSSQRVWYPTGAASLVVPAGALGCFQQVGAGDIDGEILWTTRPVPSADVGLGAGESAGESVP